MIKIGEFSKLSHLTIKALRFYEKKGLLIPEAIDERTGYRYYQTSQLESATKIKAYRQLGLTIEEIKAIQNGADLKLIPELGAECRRLNPQIKCAEPGYEFCEYLDEEYKQSDILIRHNEVVDQMGKESDRIKFREVPAVRVLSILHRGAYDEIGEAYAYIMKYCRG